MKKFSTIILFFIISSVQLFAQNGDSLEMRNLKKIYSELEYKTVLFDDLKHTWILKDQHMIREIFNKLVIEEALTYQGKPLEPERLEEVIGLVQDARIHIEFRKRYYDDEIERMKFLYYPESFSEVDSIYIDDIYDHIYLKEVLGNKLYYILKDKDYQLTDVTKDEYQKSLGYNYDIYFNMFDPYVMFWTSTSQYKDKYLLYAFGKWGSEYINMPGWYFQEYIVGFRVKYFGDVTNSLENYNYSFELGTGTFVNQPFDAEALGGPRQVFPTGSSVFGRLSGNPLMAFDIQDFELAGEVYYSFYDSKAEDFNYTTTSTFYSVINYGVISAKKSKIVNVLDFGELNLGLGVSAAEIGRYAVITDTDKLRRFESDRRTFNFFFEAGVSKNADLIHHDISFLINYNLDDDYMVYGLKAFFDISNSIGFDLRLLASNFTIQKNLPYWLSQEDYSIVFSPVIRINY